MNEHSFAQMGHLKRNTGKNRYLRSLSLAGGEGLPEILSLPSPSTESRLFDLLNSFFIRNMFLNTRNSFWTGTNPALDIHAYTRDITPTKPSIEKALIEF